MAGFIIEDLVSGKVRQFHWNDVEGLPRDGSITLLDVRTEGEYRHGHLNGFRNIPLDDLREHLDELERSGRGGCRVKKICLCRRHALPLPRF